MAKKSAEKKQNLKKTSKTRSVNNDTTKQSSSIQAQKSVSAKKKTNQDQSVVRTTKKAVMELLSKGKKQGYLTYDEINEMLPEDMLSSEQIDETFMMFDDNEIEIVEEKKKKNVVLLKKAKEKKGGDK